MSTTTSCFEAPRVLYERKDAARLLSISLSSLDRLIANKQLAARRIYRRVLIPHTELMRFSRSDHFAPSED